MSSPAKSRTCKDTPLLGAYLDGELEAQGLLDVETHLSACEVCRERVELDRATRQSLKRVVRKAAEPGLASLRARAMTAMMAEQARGDARAAEQDSGKLLRWRTMVPIATAAALALFWGAANRGPFSDSGPNGMTSNQLRAGFGDDLLAELVAQHSSPIPPQWTDPAQVRQLDQYVGVPVHPGSFERGGARLLGGGISNVHQQRAAMLQYVIGNGSGQRRLSVFIYDPNKIQISGPGLATRAVGTAEVRVGQENGYSVAVTQNRGVGYALASDLDPDKSAQLAAMADDWTE
jgi:anti-sigma factor RsiW